MKKTIGLLAFVLSAAALMAQEKVGERWVDNNLTFKVVEESVKKNGIITLCIADTVRGLCIENLQTGFELKVFDGEGKMLWEGIGSGRTKKVKLPQALPQANHLTIKAFKPHVTNKSTGTLIYQEKPIQTKYIL